MKIKKILSLGFSLCLTCEIIKFANIFKILEKPEIPNCCTNTCNEYEKNLNNEKNYYSNKTQKEKHNHNFENIEPIRSGSRGPNWPPTW